MHHWNHWILSSCGSWAATCSQSIIGAHATCRFSATSWGYNRFHMSWGIVDLLSINNGTYLGGTTITFLDCFSSVLASAAVKGPTQSALAAAVHRASVVAAVGTRTLGARWKVSFGQFMIETCFPLLHHLPR
jgi:hypothetical protein